jgi:hypothetical protein
MDGNGLERVKDVHGYVHVHEHVFVLVLVPVHVRHDSSHVVTSNPERVVIEPGRNRPAHSLASGGEAW